MMNLRGGLVFDKASTYLNFHYQGSSYTDGANSNELNKYGSLDWSAFYDVSEGVTVFTKVTNLTDETYVCLLYTSPSPRDATLSRMPSSA